MGHWIAEPRETEKHEELAERLLHAEAAGDVKLAERLRRAVSWLLNAEWFGAFYDGVPEVGPGEMALLRRGIAPVMGAAWGPREPRRGIRLCDDYQATFSAATLKKIWVHDQAASLLGVRFNTNASDRTTSSDISDVNRNGTTIFTTQGNRPTQAAATTGDWTTGYPDGTKDVVAGDTYSWDGDQASTGGTGKTGVSVALAFRYN